jgi:hypothetical protein
MWTPSRPQKLLHADVDAVFDRLAGLDRAFRPSRMVDREVCALFAGPDGGRLAMPELAPARWAAPFLQPVQGFLLLALTAGALPGRARLGRARRLDVAAAGAVSR